MTAFLFVYGTLQSHVKRLGPVDLNKFGAFLATAYARGVLYQVSADYPAMVDGSGRVPGELWLLNNPSATFTVLDAYEGDEYYRVLRKVSVEGTEIEAWVYLFSGEPRGERLEEWQ